MTIALTGPVSAFFEAERNSPLDLQHSFAVEAGKIASLEIG